MAEFVGQRFSASDINGGKHYKNGDGISADTINKVVEAALYAQNVEIDEEGLQSQINANTHRIEGISFFQENTQSELEDLSKSHLNLSERVDELEQGDGIFIDKTFSNYENTVPDNVLPYAMVSELEFNSRINKGENHFSYEQAFGLSEVSSDGFSSYSFNDDYGNTEINIYNFYDSSSSSWVGFFGKNLSNVEGTSKFTLSEVADLIVGHTYEVYFGGGGTIIIGGVEMNGSGTFVATEEIVNSPFKIRLYNNHEIGIEQSVYDLSFYDKSSYKTEKSSVDVIRSYNQSGTIVGQIVVPDAVKSLDGYGVGFENAKNRIYWIGTEATYEQNVREDGSIVSPPIIQTINFPEKYIRVSSKGKIVAENANKIPSILKMSFQRKA